MGTTGLRPAFLRARVNVANAAGLPDGPLDGNAASPLHFTGQHHDDETGLDHFPARYYTSAWGRFMTPDWSAAPTPVPYASFSDPQSLDLYAYRLDNPETNTDPDGHWCFIGIGTTCAPKKVKGGPKLAGPDWLTRCMGNLFCGAALDAGIIPVTLFSGAHGKGERGTTAKPQFRPKPGKLPKGVRRAPGRPGRMEVKDPRTGNWILKPPGWSPETAKKVAAGVGAAAGAGILIEILKDAGIGVAVGAM